MQVTMTMDEYKSMEKQIKENDKEIKRLDKLLNFKLIKDIDTGVYVKTCFGGVKFTPTEYKECTSLTINKSEIINYIKEKYECEESKDFEIIIK